MDHASPLFQRNYWLDLLRTNISAFNRCQDKLGRDELIRLDGVNLSGIDLRGACLHKVSLNGARFDSAAQIDIARRWGGILDDVPLLAGDPPPRPTHRQINDNRQPAPAVAAAMAR